MSHELKATKDKTTGQTLEVICVNCNRPTKHEVVSSYDVEESIFDAADQVGSDYEGNYQIIQCRGCETITFRHRLYSSDDAFPDQSDGVTVNLYPKRDANSLKAKELWNVPSNLRRIYREIIDTYNDESATLCAAGLRAIVEGICVDRGILDGPVEVPISQKKGGGTRIERHSDLKGKISGLSEKHLLTPKAAETLHSHRFLGNDAVHQLARPSGDELKLALEIVEHVMEQIYELPVKASTLQTSRDRKRKPATGTP